MVALGRGAVALAAGCRRRIASAGISAAASASDPSAAAASAATAMLDRAARIFIAILRVAAPDQLRLCAGFGIDFEGPQQPRDARLVFDQREILAELNARESLFGLENFRRLALERAP